MYEVYLKCKNNFELIQNRKLAKRIHSMSKQELEQYDARLYNQHTGRNLDWNNLQTYTEKMQYVKLFDNDHRKVVCTDKYAVRNWIKEKIGDKYLIPLIGCWDNYSDINFGELPEKFVMKTNKGNGDIVIVKNKSKMKLFEKMRMKRIINTALKKDFGARFCELHYGKIPPKIIVEELIGNEAEDLYDYKFLCFHGEVKFCWVDVSRMTDHRRNIYDLNWNLQPWKLYYENTDEPVKKPENFNEMVQIAKKLSEDFSHVRVDLYNVNGNIFFGELTFTSAAGFKNITPEKFDYALGDMWLLNTQERNI